MLMSWQPLTHKPYLDKVRQDVVDLGPMYTRAKLGWVVPTYVPESELKSIEDLKKPEVKQKLGSKIQGIDPGAGLMQASEKALKDYGLTDYQLVSASEAAMLSGVERAARRKEWIVATAWSPHWMFAKSPATLPGRPQGLAGRPGNRQQAGPPGLLTGPAGGLRVPNPHGRCRWRTSRSDHVRSPGQQLREGRGQLHPRTRSGSTTGFPGRSRSVFCRCL